MINLITIIVCLIAIIVSIFNLKIGWLILSVPYIYLFLTLLILKRRKWSFINELSLEANLMIKKFGHFYAMPFAGRDFSSSASVVMIGGGIIAFIGLLHSFWWGIAIGVFIWYSMGFVARAFNPTLFLANHHEEIAHNEIISHIISEKQK